jgi:hypothetical protein
MLSNVNDKTPSINTASLVNKSVYKDAFLLGIDCRLSIDI